MYSYESPAMTEVITELRKEQTLARIARRAANLIADGYRIEFFRSGVTLDGYSVYTPKGDVYLVTILKGDMSSLAGATDECNCPAFAAYGDCKHHIAVQMMLAEQAQIAAAETMLANAESAAGCDPYARY